MKILVMESGSLEPKCIKPVSAPMRAIAKIDSMRKVHAVVGGAAKAAYQIYDYFSRVKGYDVDVFADLSMVSREVRCIKDSDTLMANDYDAIFMNSLRDVLIVSGYVSAHHNTKTIYNDRGNALANYAGADRSTRLTPWMIAVGHLLGDMRKWLSVYVAITEEQTERARGFFRANTAVKYIPIAPGPEYSRNAARGPYEGAIYVGRLDERQKRVSFLIKGIAEAIRLHPYMHDTELLRVYGEGPDEARYRALVAEMGLSKNVRFLGFKSGAALVDAYNNAGFLALTSDWESPGRVLLESMACGTTVLINEGINARIDAHSRLVQDGKNGTIYVHGSIADFADKFYRLYSNRALRRRLSGNALKSAARFSLDRTMREYGRLLAK